jgi:hypothetical protein
MPDVATTQLDAANQVIVVPSNPYYLSLHHGDPGATGANEGPDGRQLIHFGNSATGTQASTDTQTWTSVIGGNTYDHFGLWTATAGGQYLRGGSLTVAITPPAGSQVQTGVGQITLTAA